MKFYSIPHSQTFLIPARKQITEKNSKTNKFSSSTPRIEQNSGKTFETANSLLTKTKAFNLAKRDSLPTFDMSSVSSFGPDTRLECSLPNSPSIDKGVALKTFDNDSIPSLSMDKSRIFESGRLNISAKCSLGK